MRALRNIDATLVRDEAREQMRDVMRAAALIQWNDRVASRWQHRLTSEELGDALARADEVNAIGVDHHFGGARTRVVVRAHAHTVRAC